MPHTIDINLGLQQIFSRWLSENGYPPAPSESAETLLQRFFALSRRQIDQRPRTIFRSTELSAQVLSPSIHSGVERVLAALASGADVSPYMSTRLEDAEFQDGLLNDWNIHHFHLGAQNPDGSIARTGELLFGMAIRPNTFYALYVGAHGSFADRRLLEIFVNNWPNVADAWRLRGIQPGPTNWNPTPEEIRTARSGMTLMLDINGHFYAPPGGGINTAGTSMSDVVEADRLRFYLRPLSSIIENAEPAIRRHMRDRGLAQKETLALAMVELTFYPIRVYLEEVTTGFRFFLNIP